MTPTISMMTPTLVDMAIRRTPEMFTRVQITSMMRPRRTAFWAPVTDVRAGSASGPPTMTTRPFGNASIHCGVGNPSTP